MITPYRLMSDVRFDFVWTVLFLQRNSVLDIRTRAYVIKCMLHRRHFKWLKFKAPGDTTVITVLILCWNLNS